MRDRIIAEISSKVKYCKICESHLCDCLNSGILAAADAILALEVGKKPCESDGMVYTSLPPKYKCKHCGKFWNKSERAPACTRTVTIQDLIGA